MTPHRRLFTLATALLAIGAHASIQTEPTAEPSTDPGTANALTSPAEEASPAEPDRAADLAEGAMPITAGADEQAIEQSEDRDEAAEESPPETDTLVELPPSPDAAILASQTPIEELALRLRPLRLAEIEPIAEAWIGHVRQTAAYISELRLLERRLARDANQTGLARVRSVIPTAIILQNDLIERAALAARTLELKGGDPTLLSAYLRSVSTDDDITAAAPDSDRDRPPPQPAIRGMPTRPTAAYDAADVSLQDLRLRLQPLLLSEIEPRAETWAGHLRQMTAYIADLRILERRLRAEDRPEDLLFVQDLVVPATDAKSNLTDRARIAADALELKGGDPAELNAYIRSVGGRVDDVNWLSPREAFYAALTWTGAWLADPESGGLDLLVGIAAFVGVVFAFWLLSRLTGKLITLTLKRSKSASGLLKQFLVGGAERVVLLIGILVALPTIGIDVTPLLAAIGAAGLVIGLALQGTLSNFASGLLILFYRPFDVGDYVDAAGVSGEVKSMTLVSTKIATFDNRVMIVPNNEVWNNVITNNSGQKVRRVDLEFDVAYDTDIDYAKAVFEEMVRSHPKVLKAPAPNIQVNAYMDSSIRFIVRPWVKSADYFTTFWQLMAEGKKRLDAAGITIPFPQRDLNFPGPVRIVPAEQPEQIGP